MSDAYGIEVKITADDSGFQQAFSGLETGLGNWGIHLDTLYKKGDELFKSFGINLDQLAGKLGTTGPVLAGMAGMAVIAVDLGKKMGEYLNKVAETGEKLYTMSQMTGMSTDTLQKLKYSVEQTEGSFESAVAGVNFMTRSLEKNISTFNALGISIKDSSGNLRTAGDIFNETLIKLSDMSNATERNQLAFQLFGRGAAALIPTLNAGSEEIKNLQQRAEDLGLVLSNKLVKAGADFKDNMDTLNQVGTSLGYTLAEILLPAFNDLMLALLEGSRAIKLAFEEFINFIGPALQTFIDTFTAVVNILSGILSGDWKRVWEGAELLVLNVIKAILDAASTMVNGVVSILNLMITGIDSVTSKFGIFIPKLVNVDYSGILGVDNAIKKLNDSLSGATENTLKLGKSTIDTNVELNEAAKKVVEVAKAIKDANDKSFDDTVKIMTDEGNAWAKYFKDLEAKHIQYLKDVADQEEQSNLNSLEAQRFLDEGLAAYDAQALLDKQAMAQDWLDQNKANDDVAQVYYLQSLQTGSNNTEEYYNDIELQNIKHYEALKAAEKTWNDYLKKDLTILGSYLQDQIVGALEKVGKNLVSGKNDWSNWGNVALTALASILDSFSKQLLAMAAVDLATGNWVGAAAAALGAIAAGVASGAITQYVASLNQIAIAAGSAATATQSLTISTTSAASAATVATTVATTVILTNIEKMRQTVEVSINDFGNTIATTLFNSLSKGLNSVDFTSAIMKQLENLVLQETVLSSGLSTEMENIGKFITSKLAVGITATDTQLIQDSLSILYGQAQRMQGEVNALFSGVTTSMPSQTTDDSGAFSNPNFLAARDVLMGSSQTLLLAPFASGTEYATAGYKMVGEQGPEIMYVPQGAKVSNARESAGAKSIIMNNNFYSPKAIDPVEAAKQMRSSQRALAFQGVIS